MQNTRGRWTGRYAVGLPCCRPERAGSPARLFPGANSAGPVCFWQRPLQDVEWCDAGAGAPNNSAVRACASAAARTAISQRRCGEGCEQIHIRGAGGHLGKPSTSNTTRNGPRSCQGIHGGSSSEAPGSRGGRRGPADKDPVYRRQEGPTRRQQRNTKN